MVMTSVKMVPIYRFYSWLTWWRAEDQAPVYLKAMFNIVVEASHKAQWSILTAMNYPRSDHANARLRNLFQKHHDKDVRIYYPLPLGFVIILPSPSPKRASRGYIQLEKTRY